MQEDRLKAGRDQRVLITVASVHKDFVGFFRNGHDVLNGVLSDEVLGGPQTHHRLLVGLRHRRLAVVGVRVSELFRWRYM